MCAGKLISGDEQIAVIRGLEALVEKQATRISELLSRFGLLESENAELLARNELLEAEVAELRALLGQGGGSAGSGLGATKPPSWVKANRAEEPRKQRKKRSENHGRPREACTEEVVHAVEVCPDCGRKLDGGWEHRRRQVIDLPVQSYVVRDHVVMRRHCGVCGKDHVPKLDLSAEVVGKSRVSIRIMALVALLKTECRMPIRVIQRLLKSLYGLSLSDGELTGLLHRVAEEGRAEYEAVREEIRSSFVVHADETGMRQGGINGYVWAFLTEVAQFFLRDQSRGSAIPKSVLTEGFSGILVSDFYSGYSPLSCRKQRCWVHLLRDLRELEEAHPDNKSIAGWRSKIRALYDKAVAYRKSQLALESPVPMRVLQQRPKVRARFESALMKLAKPYVSKRKDPRRVLAKRMEKFLYELFVFLEYPDVPPGNNLAERSLRPVVMARKSSGGTRSAKGSETLAILRTLFGTWGLRGQPALDACCALLAPQPT